MHTETSNECENNSGSATSYPRPMMTCKTSVKKESRTEYRIVSSTFSRIFISILYRWFIKFPVCDVEHVCVCANRCVTYSRNGFRLYCKMYIDSRHFRDRLHKITRWEMLCTFFDFFRRLLNSLCNFTSTFCGRVIILWRMGRASSFHK